MIIVRNEEERILFMVTIGISLGIVSTLLFIITYPSIYPLFLIIPSFVIPIVFGHFAYTRREADNLNVNRRI